MNNNITDNILNAVDTLVEARLRERGTTTHGMGKVVEIHELGRSCIVETPLGDLNVTIPRQFIGITVGTMVIFKDLFGDHQRIYIDSILTGDWTGGGGGGGGGMGGGGFRVVRLNPDGSVGDIVSPS